jgi:TolB protein
MQLSPLVSQKQVPSKPRASTQRYTSSTYGVTFSYPSNWQPTNGYEERFSGADGFFQVSALSSPPPSTLQDACNSTAQHRLKPYGSRPQVQRLQIQGRPACLILPSADQDRAMERMATLIVRYPKPIRLTGTDYNYFVLYADKEHIREIANTVRFTMPR